MAKKEKAETRDGEGEAGAEVETNAPETATATPPVITALITNHFKFMWDAGLFSFLVFPMSEGAKVWLRSKKRKRGEPIGVATDDAAFDLAKKWDAKAEVFAQALAD